MKEKGVFYNEVTGRPQAVVSTVLRKISAYTRESNVRWFKIGITNNPERRFQKHKTNYDRMVVIYRTISLDSVCELECELIEHNRELADNMIGGGGGKAGKPPYYLYVVIKYLKKR